MTERCKLVTTRWALTNKGTVEEPDVQARWAAQEFKWMDGLDSKHHAPTLGLPKPRTQNPKPCQNRQKRQKWQKWQNWQTWQDLQHWQTQTQTQTQT